MKEEREVVSCIHEDLHGTMALLNIRQHHTFIGDIRVGMELHICTILLFSTSGTLLERISTYRQFAASPVAQFSDECPHDDDNCFSDFTVANRIVIYILLHEEKDTISFSSI